MTWKENTVHVITLFLFPLKHYYFNLKEIHHIKNESCFCQKQETATLSSE